MAEEENQTQTGLLQQLQAELISARQNKELSFKTIAEQLKVSESQLSQFETPEIDFARLNSFARGYLRNYAAVLSVDLTPYEPLLQAQIENGTSLKLIEPDDYIEKKSAFNMVALVIVMLLIIVGLVLTSII